MRQFKTVAVGVIIWTALGSIAQAAPLSWTSRQAQWPIWYANQTSSDGSIVSPNNSATSFYLANYGNGWWNSPAPVAVAPAVAAARAPSVATQAQVVTPTPTPAPIIAPTLAAPATPSTQAYINFGTGAYANALSLTTGTPQAWYNSPSVVTAFGGTPSPQQQQSFTQSVIANIQHTFQISGMDVSLTTDPGVSSAHTLSVASGVSALSNPSAIGLTQVSGNGFSFIDKLSYATTPDQLAWAVAHNVAHELMHSFGVATHPDQTGTYLDAATANWSMLTDPNTRFSPEAVQLMAASMGGASGLSSSLGAELLSLSKHPVNCQCHFCQEMRQLGINAAEILQAAVPEPSTIAVWSITVTGGFIAIRRKSSRKAA